jgi:hypothetical protein
MKKSILRLVAGAMVAAMGAQAQQPNDQTTNAPNHQRTSVGLGFVNIADSIKGVQLSTVSNIAEHAGGLQLSAFSNVAYDGMKGVQERDYNMGSGFSAKIQTNMDVKKVGYMNIKCGNGRIVCCFYRDAVSSPIARAAQ